LHHTSGIRSYTDVGEAFDRRVMLDLTHDEVLALVRDEPLRFSPRTKWEYSNTGYFLLGMVVERASGEPYQQYLTRHMFRPVGLQDTVYCSERRILKHRARGYEVDGADLFNSDYLSMEVPFSGGALCSSAVDLARWEGALWHGSLLSQAGVRHMQTP